MKKRTRKEETCGAAAIAGHLLVSLQSLYTSLKKRRQQPTCGPVLDNVSLCSEWYNRAKYSAFKIISANTGGTGASYHSSILLPQGFKALCVP